MKRLKEIIEGNYTVIVDTIEQFEIFTKVYSVLNNIRFDKFIYLHLEYSELVNYSFTSVVYLNTVKINASEIAECFFEKDCYYSCQTLDGTKYTFQFIKLEDNNLYVNQYTLEGYTEQDFKSQWDFSYNTNFKKITEQEAKGMETKEDLLEEAKRRYPIGTKFISLVPEDANMIREIKPYQGHDTVELALSGNKVWCKNGLYNNTGGCSNPFLYEDGEWAEIVETPVNKSKAVVHCKTQEEWDFVSKTIGRNWGDAGWKTYKENVCICLPEHYYGNVKFYTKENYYIYSFEEWCKEFGHSMKVDYIEISNQAKDRSIFQIELDNEFKPKEFRLIKPTKTKMFNTTIEPIKEIKVKLIKTNKTNKL